MKQARPLLIVAVVGLVLIPSSGWAGGRGHPGGRGHHGGVVVVAPRGSVVVVRPSPVFVHPVPRVFAQPRSVFPTVVDPWRFWGVPQRFPHHGFGHGVPFAGFGYGSSIGYAVPAVYGYAPAGYGSPYAYASDVYGLTSAVATASPAMPSVVEYPGGRYELRGDGITVPYVWVWIPNAPLGPPPTPAAPPALAPSGSAPIAERPSRAQRTHIYRWTDDQGVVNLTDDLNNVPERYRTQARAR